MEIIICKLPTHLDAKMYSKEFKDFLLKDIVVKGTKYIRYNKYGKPLLPYSDYYFNISHSKNIIVGVISKGNDVGIDVEKNFLMEKNFSNIFLSISEQKYCSQINYNSSLLLKIWTIKEAYLKMIGLGLNFDIRKITLDTEMLKNNIFNIDDKAQIFSWEFNDYILSLAVERYIGDTKPNISYIPFSYLRRHLYEE